MIPLYRRLAALAAVPGLLTGLLVAIGIYYLATGALLQALFGLTALAVAASIIWSVWSAARVTRGLIGRIQEMRDVARRVSAGVIDEKVYAPAADEMGLLAEDLNQMIGRLSQRIRHLQDQTNRLEAILNNLQDGVILLGARYRVVHSNPAAQRLLDLQGDANGRFLLEVVPNTDLEEKVRQVLAGGGVASQEVRRGLREEVVLLVQIAPVLDEKGITGALLVLRDVTRERRLERSRVEFVANASHELQTPLTAIRGFAETLLDGMLEGPAASKRFVEIIHREALRLSELVDDLLDLSKIESGHAPIAQKALDLAALAHEVAQRMEVRLTERNLRLDYEFPSGLPAALADRSQIARVYMNLLDNAVKYTPAGGVITMGAEDRGTHLSAYVRDTGAGIPAQDQARIFERFYRVDKARSRDSGGTGLGLAIVKHIVEAHGGQVGVQSEPGAGTTITFTIPRILA